MTNLFDYIKWRGDLTLAQSPFTDVDGLVLTCLSYHFYHNVLTQYDHTPVTIRQIAQQMRELPEHEFRIRDPQDIALLQLVGKSTRYGSMQLCFHVDYVDLEKEAQFSAITIFLGDGTAFVAFRGTDLSLAGWKEDFNMTFREFVPAQIGAAAYLLHISQHFEGNIRVGGHSKGGNLAVFAAAICPNRVKDRLIVVYNHDGPGFHSGMLRFQGYLDILPKVKTFVPQSSVIGMLLNHQGEYTVVQSAQKGLFQHDPYSWGVMGADFVCLEAVTVGSKFVDRTLKGWLKSLPLERREVFVDTLFEILATTHVDDAGDVVLSVQNTYRTLHALNNEDEETKAIILEGIRLLWRATKQTAGDYGAVLQRLAELKLQKK